MSNAVSKGRTSDTNYDTILGQSVDGKLHELFFLLSWRDVPVREKQEGDGGQEETD